ncbi:MAG: MmgE/PrpD family protein [Betaproteobacteria bacterium]
MASLSRQLARWVAALTYADLPPVVIDRAKGVTLQSLSSILIGAQTKPGRDAVRLMADEEAGVKRGATILVSGEKVTKGGAVFANSEMAFAGGKWDTFRMLMHPGTSVPPCALAAAEETGASGQEFITALAAGYEVMERLAADFIPTLAARGFHASPVFGIFGGAVAAAKIFKANEDELNSTIALCASLASGNLEGARSGGRALREGAAVRNAMLAVALARGGHVGGETVLEGDAGFYHAYVGNNQGKLIYSFVGDTHARLDKITEKLGQEWIFLETLYRIYSISGYNIAHIDVTAKLCADNNIQPKDIDRIEAVVNWLETQYPSPAFAVRREDTNKKAGSTAYHIAYAAIKRGFPMLNEWAPQTAGKDDPPEVLELTQRVTIIPSATMTLFGPRITIFTRDGKSYTSQGTGREFIWDFEEQARRIRGIDAGLPIPVAQYEKIIETCRRLDQQPRADALVKLMVKQ